MGASKSTVPPILNNTNGNVATSIFQFSVPSIQNTESIILSQYSNKKAFLIVNVVLVGI